jgi:RimJ/RimL family protein N-acetyltransferase
VTKIRTYLEMTSLDELRPGRIAPDVALEPLSDRDLIRSLEIRVGTPHGWPSLRRTDEGWEREFEKDYLHWWRIAHQGESVGVLVLADRPPEVEILTFGLVPEAVGRGIGGHALTLALREAWALRDDVTRVWLHTNNQDHPNALPNYQARGLRSYRTEEVSDTPG